MTYSYSNDRTFTETNANYIAAKVAADLKRLQRFYGDPDDARIVLYQAELVQLLKHGGLAEVAYGFQRNGQWIEPTLIYKARELYGMASRDDDPGAIRPNADIRGASFHSYLIYSETWLRLPEKERASLEQQLPFRRTGAAQPGIDGYVTSDHIYASGDRALNRSTVKKL